jgi:uncharacterized protein (DUF58 family)
MIVPRPVLILLAAITLIPLTGLGVSIPGFAMAAVGIIALVLAIAAWDAWQGLRHIRSIRVILPEKLHCVQGRASQLELIFETTATRPLRLQVGLGFPDTIKPALEELTISLPPRAGRHHILCECQTSRRGLFFIAGCYFEFPSPLRLWDVRGKNTQPIRVQVYPNLQSERKQVASLFLHTQHAGMRAVRQVGQGRDFEKLREYVPGDGYDTIHWKASAHRGHPITKVFQVEKTQEVYVVIDSSRLSGRLQDPSDPSKGTHLDRYIAATLVLGLAAEKQGDLFGLVTFNNHVQSFVRARNGKEHYHACREALYRLEPQPVSPDFEEVASFIRLRLRRRALLVFMTDLDDPVLMQSFQRSADLICRQHLILVQMLQSGRVRPVFTNPDVASVDDVYRDLAQHLAWSDLRQLTISLQQHGVTLSLLGHEQFSAETTSNYLRVKQRQLI